MATILYDLEGLGDLGLYQQPASGNFGLTLNDGSQPASVSTDPPQTPTFFTPQYQPGWTGATGSNGLQWKIDPNAPITVPVMATPPGAPQAAQSTWDVMKPFVYIGVPVLGILGLIMVARSRRA